MKKQSKKVIPKKGKRGRPATGRDPVVPVRLSPALQEMIENWADQQADGLSRSEAIRRLVELGLAGSRPMRRRSPKAASKASDMAAQQIDKLIGSSATADERQQRKRRLLKGPTEFRDFRGDLPKPKG